MTLSPSWPSAAGLALGFATDRILGDPRRWHPVAGFGRLAGALERRTYTDSRGAGIGHVLILVGMTGASAVIMERLAARRTWLRIALTAGTTWTVLGGQSLSREARIVAAKLARDDLAAAREQVRNLVGRDTAELATDEIARACVESVAENTSDAVVAPLLWGALAGMPGLLVYRAINTLDAMIGHRSARYRRFGWAAARLDDLVNLVPARVSGLVAAHDGAAGRRHRRLGASGDGAGRGGASQPQRRGRGGGFRRSAGCAARRAQHLCGPAGGSGTAG